MKSNKGFTLVEMLATVTIMLLITTIVTVSSVTIINKNNTKEYNSYIDQFISNTKLYAIDHKNEVNEKIDSDGCYMMSLQNLLDFELIEKIPKNPLTDEKFNSNDGIIITKNIDGTFKYDFKQSPLECPSTTS